MKTRAFSLVEVILTLTIAAALASISISTYREYQEEGERTAVIQDLDAIKRAVELYETQTHRPYRKATPPVASGLGFQGKLSDQWGNPYRISPENSMVYSYGENGIDEGGSGDDISLEINSLDSTPLLEPPRSLSVEDDGSKVRLTWSPPRRGQRPKEYRIERRSGRSSQWQEIAKVPHSPSESPEFADDTAPKGVSYYRITAIDSEGLESKPSEQAGWAARGNSRPSLFVLPKKVNVKKGESIEFDLRCQSFGSKLDCLEFDGEEIELEGSKAELRLSRAFEVSKSLRIELLDEEGRKSITKLEVKVRD